MADDCNVRIVPAEEDSESSQSTLDHSLKDRTTVTAIGKVFKTFARKDLVTFIATNVCVFLSHA